VLHYYLSTQTKIEELLHTAWSKKQKPETVYVTPIPPRRKLELTIRYIASEDSILSLQLNLGYPE